MPRLHRNIAASAAALVAALVVAAPAGAAKAKYPTVRSVVPLKAGIGNTLTIRGKYFRKGKNKSTVIFRSEKGGRTVFAKAQNATTTRITIVIPAKLMPYMKTSGNTIQPTRFRIRIVGRKLGKKYTANSKSPVIGAAAVAQAANSGDTGDCDGDAITNGNESDDDNDMLSDSLEVQIHTNTCNADSDGDGISDGFEYHSALEYNSLALPYPGKRPYANALDPDSNVDYDGDGLQLWQEYAAWIYTGRPFPLSYAEGTQWTGGKTPAAQAGLHGWGATDLDGDGTIADFEKDVDNDRLTNYSETGGPMMGPEWWQGRYGPGGDAICAGHEESPYPVSSFAGTNFVDTDTDGDGLPDGPDDIDHDGYSNFFEQFRPTNWCTTYVSTSHSGGVSPNPVARVQPFNPCKPTYSDLCHLVVPAGAYQPGEDWASPYHGTL